MAQRPAKVSPVRIVGVKESGIENSILICRSDRSRSVSSVATRTAILPNRETLPCRAQRKCRVSARRCNRGTYRIASAARTLSAPTKFTHRCHVVCCRETTGWGCSRRRIEFRLASGSRSSRAVRRGKKCSTRCFSIHSVPTQNRCKSSIGRNGSSTGSPRLQRRFAPDASRTTS
jgi:hypothetical protein